MPMQTNDFWPHLTRGRLSEGGFVNGVDNFLTGEHRDLPLLSATVLNSQIFEARRSLLGQVLIAIFPPWSRAISMERSVRRNGIQRITGARLNFGDRWSG
jgi:hypothetical protein